MVIFTTLGGMLPPGEGRGKNLQSQEVTKALFPKFSDLIFSIFCLRIKFSKVFKIYPNQKLSPLKNTLFYNNITRRKIFLIKYCGAILPAKNGL